MFTPAHSFLVLPDNSSSTVAIIIVISTLSHCEQLPPSAIFSRIPLCSASLIQTPFNLPNSLAMWPLTYCMVGLLCYFMYNAQNQQYSIFSMVNCRMLHTVIIANKNNDKICNYEYNDTGSIRMWDDCSLRQQSTSIQLDCIMYNNKKKKKSRNIH